MNDPGKPTISEDAARRLLGKIRDFVTTELDEQEGALFATLLAPGVALAYPDEGDEVSGYSAEFRSDLLPESLAETVRQGGLRVEGLGAPGTSSRPSDADQP